MSLKDDIAKVLAAHPDWSVNDIAWYLRAKASTVRLCAKRHGILITKADHRVITKKSVGTELKPVTLAPLAWMDRPEP